jgi:hypothetical protein
LKKLEIINIIKEELSLLTEAKVKKGDVIYDKSYDEYGVVNKVKGRVAYIKFQSTGAKSFDPVLVSDIKYKGKHKGKDLYVTEAICADQSHRYEKEESVAPDHDGKAAPYGSGYDKVTEDYSQRARNFRVALRRRLEKMKKGQKIKYGKQFWTAQGKNNFRDSLRNKTFPNGRLVPGQDVVQALKFAAQSDIMKHRGAAGDDMVNAYLKFEGKYGLSLELNKIKNAINMFQDKIKKQGRITNARDEEHLKKLIALYKKMGGKGINEATSLWKHFDAKMKLQDEIMDLEMDMKTINRDLSQLHKDMEQEAEPEGGPKATRYGRDIEKKEKEYKKKKAEFKKLMAKLDRMEQY